MSLTSGVEFFADKSKTNQQLSLAKLGKSVVKCIKFEVHKSVGFMDYIFGGC